MKDISVYELKDGMILKEDITDFNQDVLISNGTKITNKEISVIFDLGIGHVLVDDTELRRVENLLKANRLIANEMKYYSRKNLATMVLLKKKDYRQVVDINSQLLNEIFRDEIMLKFFRALRKTDTYTFLHSINVYSLCLTIGFFLNLEFDELKKLAIGALLHDIGKIKVTKEILKKPSHLTKYEFDKMKKHVIAGYEFVKRAGYSEEIAEIAYLHHKKLDGSGYPDINKEIKLLVRIATIADAYDALISDRVYKRGLTPSETIDEIEKGSRKLFDERVVKLLKKHIPLYIKGTAVVLSQGLAGVVLKENEKDPYRPVVIVFYKNNSRLEKPYKLNLLKNNNIKIIDTAKRK